MKHLYIKWFVLISLWIYYPLVHAESVWIDTDPACGISRTSDVDDCWALYLALQSPELEVVGISTVFGNSNGFATYHKTHEVVSRMAVGTTIPKINRGSDQKLDRRNIKPTVASQALAKSLKQGPLSILALGPLTNIATVLQTHPGLASQIKQIIAVAGKRPKSGLGFYPGNTSILHLHDVNFRKDVEAFDIVLNSSIPTVLIPYELAAKVKITSLDLQLMLSNNKASQWLAKISEPWLSFWENDLKVEGFFPFDSLAVAYTINKQQFQCENIPAKIEHKRSLFIESRDDLIVSHDYKNGRVVNYCHDVDLGLKLL